MASPTPARTILVADDESAIVFVLGDVLRAAGYHVLTAPDGLSAIRVADTHAIDAAILDINMPGTDGFTVATALRQRFALRQLPEPEIWIMTGAPTQEAVTRAKAVGARKLLRKPFGLIDLLRDLQEAFTAREARVGGEVLARS